MFSLFRGSLFTAAFGATATSDAFNRAFVVPNAIYTIVTGGALASAFRPVFNAYLLEKGDESDAWCVASSALNNDSVCLSHPAGFVCDAGCYSRDSLDTRPRAGNC